MVVALITNANMVHYRYNAVKYIYIYIWSHDISQSTTLTEAEYISNLNSQKTDELWSVRCEDSEAHWPRFSDNAQYTDPSVSNILN